MRIDEGPNSLTLKWREPWFKPKQLRIKATCTYACSDEGIEFSEIVDYEGPKVNIDLLEPGMSCQVHFLAVYNPVAIDDGMYFNTTTQSLRKYI